LRVVLLSGGLAGLRLAEALALEWEENNSVPWVDFARDRIVLPAEFVKAVKDQWVPLDPALRAAFESLPRLGRKVFRFPTPKGTPATEITVSHRVAKLAKKAGVRLTMKTLRKGFGCYYAARVSAHVLQKLMRHSSIPTTMAFYANVDDAVMEAVLCPNTVMPLAVTKQHGIRLVEDALKAGSPVGVVALRNKDASPPSPEDVYAVGTVAIIQKMIKVPDGTLRCIISGTVPFKVEEFTQAQPYLAAKIEQLEENTVDSDEMTALSRNLAAQYTKLLSFLPSAPKELELEVNNISDPNLLSYFIASTMRLETSDKQLALEERDTLARLRMLTAFLTRELEVLELGHKIQTDIQKEMDKNQREYYLRQQLKAIQDELGESDPTQADVNELREKVTAAKMPPDAEKASLRGLDRLGKVPSAGPEYSVIRTYLDWLVTLPWSATTEDSLDIAKARKILDEDHYGLEKVKDRILEYLAVRKLREDAGVKGYGRSASASNEASASEQRGYKPRSERVAMAASLKAAAGEMPRA